MVHSPRCRKPDRTQARPQHEGPNKGPTGDTIKGPSRVFECVSHLQQAGAIMSHPLMQLLGIIFAVAAGVLIARTVNKFLEWLTN